MALRGRRGFYDEQMVKKIVNSANKIILWALEGKGIYKNLEPSVKLEIASRFALKAMPQVLEGEIGNAQIVQVFIPKNDTINNTIKDTINDTLNGTKTEEHQAINNRVASVVGATNLLPSKLGV